MAKYDVGIVGSFDLIVYADNEDEAIEKAWEELYKNRDPFSLFNCEDNVVDGLGEDDEED